VHHPFEEHLKRLGSSDGLLFSTDVTKGFHLVRVARSCWKYLCFKWEGKYYCYTVLPFGLMLSPFVFQIVMDELVCAATGIPSYVDDFAWRDTAIELMKRLLTTCKKRRITLKGSKTLLAVEKIDFLGQVFTMKGVRIRSGRVDDLQRILPIESREGTRSFLGILLYIDRYLPSVAIPGVPEAEVKEYRSAVRKLQQVTDRRKLSHDVKAIVNVCAETIVKYCVNVVSLSFPVPGVVCQVFSDASKDNVGGYVCQEVDGKVKYLGFCLKAFSKHSLAWPMATKELAGLTYSLSKFSSVITLSLLPPMARVDNSALKDIANGDDRAIGSVKHHKAHAWVWVRLLQLVRFFQCEVQWVKGSEHKLADLLSRALGLQESEPVLPHSNCKCEGCDGIAEFFMPFEVLGM
jgi:hypothetical protein